MDRPRALIAVAEAFSGGKIKDLSEAVEAYGNIAFETHNNNMLLQERLAELELAIDDMGWESIGGDHDGQISKTALDKINRMAKVYWLKNPLIKRAVATQTSYVFSRGLEITATDSDVTDVINAFMDDRRNKAELMGQQARMTKETELQVEANLFFTFFTDPNTGSVRIRTIPMSEISRIVYNPEDSREPWYYLREWTQPKEIGSHKTEIVKRFYPDINHYPKTGLLKNINGIEVARDTPLYHVKTNCLSDMDFGVSEVYAAIDWAKAYKEFLEDWYAIVKSLSKFAWNATSKAGSKGFGAAKGMLDSIVSDKNTDGSPSPLPKPTGAVFMSSDNLNLTPIPKSGATVAVEDGRRALLMVSAATGIFEHYFGDPSTGNLATTKAMEQPMLFMFKDRQELWKSIFTNILNYVIDQSAIKPGGKLRGNVAYDDYGERYVDTGDLVRTFEVSFPDILKEDVTEKIGAIVDAVTLKGRSEAGTIDLKTATTQMVTELGMDTSIVDVLFPEEPRPWSEVNAERQIQALKIAQGQASVQTPSADDNGEGEGEPAGSVEESYKQAIETLVKELRENGI